MDVGEAREGNERVTRTEAGLRTKHDCRDREGKGWKRQATEIMTEGKGTRGGRTDEERR